MDRRMGHRHVGISVFAGALAAALLAAPMAWAGGSEDEKNRLASLLFLSRFLWQSASLGRAKTEVYSQSYAVEFREPMRLGTGLFDTLDSDECQKKESHDHSKDIDSCL